MKLDKRIENERLIYTPFTATKPKLHEKGYFTDDIRSFKNLEHFDCRYGELIQHINDSDYGYPYCCEFDDRCGDEDISVNWYAFYIPESSLKSTNQKKFRPYTLEEFCNEGFEIVVFRDKNDDSLEYHVRYNGYIKYDNDVYLIIFGNTLYPLNELFENYEYLDDDGIWKPFGVEVTE